jgi:hypothetical protein
MTGTDRGRDCNDLGVPLDPGSQRRFQGAGVSSPAERITVADDGEHVVMRCTRCHRQGQFAYLPTAELLRGMERFVKAHADCRQNRRRTSR